MTRQPPSPSNSPASLAFAARHGDSRALADALARGEDPNDPDEADPPLCLAAAAGHLECVLILLAAGSDPDPDLADAFLGVETPLQCACRRHGGGEAIVRSLLRAGADPNREDPDPPPLTLAAAWSGPLTRLLLTFGAIPAWSGGSHPFATAAEFACPDAMAAIAAILSAEELTQGAGVVALCEAAAVGQGSVEQIFYDLESKGVNPNERQFIDRDIARCLLPAAC